MECIYHCSITGKHRKQNTPTVLRDKLQMNGFRAERKTPFSPRACCPGVQWCCIPHWLCFILYGVRSSCFAIYCTRRVHRPGKAKSLWSRQKPEASVAHKIIVMIRKQPHRVGILSALAFAFHQTPPLLYIRRSVSWAISNARVACLFPSTGYGWVCVCE